MTRSVAFSDVATTVDGGVPRPSSVGPTSLSALASEQGTVHGSDVTVTGITASSDRVRPGDLFAALPGRGRHGASFAAGAVAAGAAAVLTDAAGAALLSPDVPVLEVRDVREALGPIAAEIYGRPSTKLRMLGVTGTSGKTTTTFLMRAGLLAAGRAPGLIGTVATMIGADEVKTGFTTPEAPDLQALLAVMVERGVTDVAMEVSSHALVMGRVGGIGFDVAGFLNLSEDHLDFHTDMDDYFHAKARLFDRSDEDHHVVCCDDSWGKKLVLMLGPCVTVETTGGRSGAAAWQAYEVADVAGGATHFRVRGPSSGPGRQGRRPAIELAMGCAIPGRYNVANAVVAVAMLYEAGVDPEAAAAAISTASVPGRMERIDVGQPFLAIVDYSHKPAAVDGALRALRPLTDGRLIVVLGCGGDRDRGKRPHMGEFAARGADLLIVTDDNPRSEDPAEIRRAMLEGASAVPAGERGEVREVGDRAEAIRTAVRAAGPRDTVLVAGKGHETGQEIAGTVHPFDDRVVLRDELELR